MNETIIPAGIGLQYPEEHGAESPNIHLEGGEIIFPAFIRQDAEGFVWIPVAIPYKGQDLDDYEKLKKQCYAELRGFFYGTPEQQIELQYKGKLNIHINAVRKAFPNPYKVEKRTVFTRFEVLKAFMTIQSLYNSVVSAYQNNIQVQLYWNSVDDIDLNHPDCIAIRQLLGITDELVDQLVEIIENA
jgi:hypothetical protein